MSDSYTVDGVTVTPAAGGFYDLTHPSLPVPERVRGKETADARAQEIAAAAAPADGSMPEQPPLDELTPVDAAAAPEAPVAPAPPKPTSSKKAAVAPVSEITELKSLVAQQAEMIQKLLDMSAATVVTEGEGGPVNQFASMPREFSGQVDASTRKAAKAIGVEYVTILLEESSDIPPTGLFLGHNGRSYMISPGEPVDVPDFLLGILDDAVMATPITDSKTQKVLGYRNRTKYPYRRL